VTKPQPGATTPPPAAALPRRTPWLGWVQNAIGVAILAGFGYYLWAHRDHFTSVLEVSVGEVAAMAALVLLTFVVASGQSFTLYRAAGVKISFVDNFLLALTAYFGNYLPMRAGTLVRARYLKAVHGLRYARFVSVNGIRMVITLVATGVMGLVGTVGVAMGGGELSVPLLSVFLAFALTPCTVLLLRVPERREGMGRLRRILTDAAEGFADLRRQPIVSLVVLALTLVQHASVGCRFYIAAGATGSPPSAVVVVLLAPLAALAGFAAVTPGGIGLREALMGYATHAIGESFATGVYVGTVDRAVLVGMVALAGGPSFLWVWARVRRADPMEVPAATADQTPSAAER